MSTLRKFLFDNSFDELDAPMPGGTRPGPEPAYPRAAVDAARDEGFAAGREAALAEAAQEASTRALDALDGLRQGLAALCATRDEINAETERAALALLRSVLQKALPALTRTDPLAELEAFVTRCLDEAADEPRIVLRVSDGLFDAVQARIGALAQSNGYAGKLVLLADANLADGDGRVEWADGGAERDAHRFLAELDAILSRGISAPPENQENLHG
jgi:flagellar assembly protein FliH